MANKFCYNCGAKLEDGVSYCSSCGTKMPEEIKAENADNTESLKSDIQANQTVEKIPQETSIDVVHSESNNSNGVKKKKLIIGICVGVGALALIVVAVLVFFFVFNKVKVDGTYKYMGEDTDTYTFNDSNKTFKYSCNGKYTRDDRGTYTVEDDNSLKLTADSGESKKIYAYDNYIYLTPYFGDAEPEVKKQSFTGSVDTEIKDIKVTMAIKYHFDTDGTYSEDLTVDYDSSYLDDGKTSYQGTYTVDSDTGLVKMTEDDGDVEYCMIQNGRFYKSVYEKIE